MRRLHSILYESRMDVPIPLEAAATSTTPLGGSTPNAPRHKPRLTEDRKMTNNACVNGVVVDEQCCSRKQSNSDLQSRLKTRKLLGVGELNGSEETTIYKSKISQLLGINESLYVKLPKGLLYWNSVNTIYFYVFGTLYLLLPSLCFLLELGSFLETADGALIGRMYGCVLITLGITFRNFLSERESRADIAFMLVAVAFMHFLHLFVMFASGNVQILTALVRLAVIVGNLIYHAYVDSQGGLHRQLNRWFQDWSLYQYHNYETSPARNVVRERVVSSVQEAIARQENENEQLTVTTEITTKSFEDKKSD